MTTRTDRDGVVVIGEGLVAEAVARQRSGHGGVISTASAAEEIAAAAPGLVFVDLADDAATIGVLASLVEDLSAALPQIVVNIRDPGLRRTVDDNLRARGIAPRPAIVSTLGLAAAAAIAEIRPFDLAYWRGQTRVHAAIVGFSALGRHCFEQLVLAGIAGDLDRPRITILDPDPVAIARLIEREMPEIDVSAEVAVHPFDPLTFTAGDGALALAESVDPITLVVVAIDEPEAALAAMGALGRTQERDGQAMAAVLVLSERHAPLLRLSRPAGRDRDLGRRWSVRGGIEADHDVLDLLTHRADELAERIHEVYRARFPGPASIPWADLPETYRRANRLAADHLVAKLWTIGLREAASDANAYAVEPHAHTNVILPCAQSTSEDALLRRLSRMEHDRWCAERRLDGWRFGTVRDDPRRIHPKLIPFDDPRFTDEDIEKDADQIRFLFGNVVASDPHGAVTPLVIGILSGPREAPGVGVEAALRLCRAEAWRPIVVVSPLLDSTECALLAELDAALTADGRAWRLVIPETVRGNATIRTISTPDDKVRLAAFLDRPSTRFAPIGVSAEAADSWADPSAPDPLADAIAAYVAARASAIVDRRSEGAAQG